MKKLIRLQALLLATAFGTGQAGADVVDDFIWQVSEGYVFLLCSAKDRIEFFSLEIANETVTRELVRDIPVRMVDKNILLQDGSVSIFINQREALFVENLETTRFSCEKINSGIKAVLTSLPKSLWPVPGTLAAKLGAANSEIDRLGQAQKIEIDRLEQVQKRLELALARKDETDRDVLYDVIYRMSEKYAGHIAGQTPKEPLEALERLDYALKLMNQ